MGEETHGSKHKSVSEVSHTPEAPAPGCFFTKTYMYNTKFHRHVMWLFLAAYVLSIMFDRPQHGLILGISGSLMSLFNEQSRKRIDELEKRVRELESKQPTDTADKCGTVENN